MGNYYPSHNYGPEHAAQLAAAAGVEYRPPSQKRLDANRRNSQKSTGPKTAAGKAKVSQNASRHGLTGQINVFTKEDQKAKDAFCNPIILDLKPKSALEKQLASAIADDHFRLNRIRSIENNIFALGHYGEASDIDVENVELLAALTQARVFLESGKELERLTLYSQRIHRDLAKNTAQLEGLQAKRKAERDVALEQAAQLSRIDENLKHPDGFVFAPAEIKLWVRRHEALKEVAFREKRNWNPDLQYVQAA